MQAITPINLIEMPVEILTHIIRYLSPKEQCLTKVVCKRWAEITNGLGEIDLSMRRITVSSVERNTLNLFSLKEVNLSDSNLESSRALSIFIQKAPLLRKLNLSGIALTASDISKLSFAISIHPCFDSLVMRGCKLKDVSLTPLGMILRKLKNIDLAANNLKGDILKTLFLKEIASEVDLNFVGLENNEAGVAGLNALADVIRLGLRIKSLVLSSNSLDSTALAPLASVLETHPNVIHLYLGNNNLKNQGALLIAKTLYYNQSLSYLDLSGNLIGSEGMSQVAGRAKSSLISYLSVKGNRIIKADQRMKYVLESGNKLLFA